MKNFSRAMSSQLTSSALLAVIIGSLCFSVGEGLRLTPFPVSTLAQNEQSEVFIVKASDKLSFSQYGPLDVPAQPQKRSKRQGLDLACPDSGASRKVVVIPFSYLFEHEAAGKGSLVFVPRSDGRAPPSFS